MSMLIEEVIERLNEGQKLEELAEQLGMSPTQLKLKLTNAAVEYDEKSFEWVYRGIVKEKSLTRDITKTIKRLKEDKPYIKVKENRRDYGDENRDKYLTLFRDYLEIDQDSLSEKKTFFLTENLYKTIKQLSKDKSMKINVLVNLLLTMGLDHYGIGIKQNSEGD